jgi:RNA polymerase sigma factor (sigma-70 family)
VARNSLLQHTRKRHFYYESLSGLEHRSAAIQIEEESDLFDWIQVLEEDEREICLMRYVDALDYESIAGVLQIPVGTVKWKLHRIKKKMAVRLGYVYPGRKS